MLALLPLITFTVLFLFIYRYNYCWRSSLLWTAITWGVLLTFITEVLSLFKLITWGWLAGIWGLLSLTLIFAYFRTVKPERVTRTEDSQHGIGQNGIGQSSPSTNGQNPNNGNAQISGFLLVLLGGIGFLVAIVGLTAIVAPPNTWDSMTYHMSRVLHWMQHHSVAHYPTHIPRQLYQNPWAEFTIMHFQLLSGGDRLANLVQWFSMIGSVIGVSLIAKELGAAIRGQVFAAVVAATIPMGILQGSSTQNDYVVSFWVICLAYFIILTIKSRVSWINILGVGATMGMAIVTKATAYIYTLPLFIWFSLMMIKRLRWRWWKPILAVGVIVILLNLGHYIRNFELYGTPIATASEELRYTNEIFTTSVLVSNILRNIGLHLGTPIGIINAISNKIINLCHLVLSVDISDPRTTYTGNFGIPGSLSTLGINATENNTSNTLHLVLIVFSVIACFIQRQGRKQRYIISYIAVIISIFLLFCFLLKWQWWNSRLHLPIFLLFSAVVGIVLSQIKLRQVANVIAVVLIITSLPWALSGRERPLLGANSIFNTSRTEQYFNSKSRIQSAYLGASDILKSNKCTDIGLYLGDNDWEYPLWILLQEQTDLPVRIKHINVKNTSASKSEVSTNSEFIPCAIFSTKPEPDKTNQAEEITYQNIIYPQAWSKDKVKIFLSQKKS
ncbi:glycosyltransferase family 39 protein [Moorena producens JHB]|uniref:Glycosyltransferase family 39 protein n=1 Tax=Moorena producens (strain JHB) TaxID=1454205 RepID=A0A1D9FVR5_MOOP1|nr:glycosyltransferase family 39 protein [Moorena producens]AOY79469.1 glycosyltransferase family 39 protein [Moorena producens JHB]